MYLALFLSFAQQSIIYICQQLHLKKAFGLWMNEIIMYQVSRKGFIIKKELLIWRLKLNDFVSKYSL